MSARGSESAKTISSTVAICAYTEDRWPMLVESVRSAQEQTLPPVLIIVCIDHNPALAERCRAAADGWMTWGSAPVEVVENEFDGRLGSARNTALRYAKGDIVAFLDDDASASEHWLEHMLAPYQDERVVAVGGAPRPVFATSRPSWFPIQFDWVFGCYYDGLPVSLAPTTRLIGASMSARRDALESIGGFHSDNHDDMDMCHRLAHQFPSRTILLEPEAIVWHNVTEERVTWSYFWRRCFFVNKGKVKAFRDMGSAASLDADRQFVMGAIKRCMTAAVNDAVRGDMNGFVRLAALIAGISLAMAGHLAGQAELYRPGRGS
jgi:GT2 family glycosyltransferase